MLRVFGVAVSWVYHEGFVEFLVAEEPVFQMAFRLRGKVFDYGMVDFATVALLEDFVHAREGLAGLGEEDDAADRTVEPMDDAAEDIAGLLVADLEEGFDLVGQAWVAGLVGLDYLPGELVEREKMVVFVDYLIGNRHLGN